MRHSALAAGLAMAIVATSCGDGTEPERAPAATPADETIERVSTEGPVELTVTLSPAEPGLIDPLVLTLTVVSEPGVSVEMPAFGEALGRFSVVDFTPREVVGSDGRRTTSQRYTLQAPMSGRQRIPPLRVEFIDEREDRVQAGEQPRWREVLTEEIQVQVASVLPEDAPLTELRPARGPLEELRSPAVRWPWLVAMLALAAGGLTAWWWRRSVLERRRISAYDLAMARLARLEERGLPAPDEADAWYVDVSYIVRHYLEDRHGVRAPELTTEEFLREARRSAELTPEHRDLLSVFLERCDRVKFAGYLPGEEESRETLAAARRFLEETRLRPGDQSPAGERRAEAA